MEHMLGHKISLNKFKRTEIISSIFSKHNAMKLDINHRKKNEKNKNTWSLNKMLLKNQWANEEISRKSENTLRQTKVKTQLSKICGTQQKNFLVGSLQQYTPTSKNKKNLK